MSKDFKNDVAMIYSKKRLMFINGLMLQSHKGIIYGVWKIEADTVDIYFTIASSIGNTSRNCS